MDSNYLTNPLVFLVQVIFGIYSVAVLLRFLFQLVRADFYNPLSQFIVKITKPLLNPLRRVIPGYGGWDFASLVLGWLVLGLELGLVMALNGHGAQPVAALALAIPELASLLLNIFIVALLLQVILSWISPGGYNPAIGLIHSLTQPLLRPVQRRLPDMGGLDLSPMVVMIGLYLLKMLLIPPLNAMVRQILL
jgi:YggT family protein